MAADPGGRAVVLIIGAIAALAAAEAGGMDHLVLRRGDGTVGLDGRTMIVAQDGSVMFQTRDGTIWLAASEEVQGLSSDETPFQPFTKEQIAARLLAELPAGFDVYQTSNYVICHSTSRGYAQWCGALLERLEMAFTNYWTRKGFVLARPEFPLVAIVFAEKKAYADFSRPEVGEGAESVVAYYSLRTNRITMYDLTGVEAGGGSNARLGSAAQINRILAQPAAAPTVATIVHEATHQIAYNCGLHARYSDCPLWFSEGIAMYFETPDLTSSRGWRSIGQINALRLRHFRDYVRHRPPDSLATLLGDDARLRDSGSATDAYAEAWALTYFLAQQKPKEYVEYLRTLSRKAPQRWDEPDARLAEFKEAFGYDLEQLESEFLRFFAKLR